MNPQYLDSARAPQSFAVLAERLRHLRVEAGQPSFSEISRRISIERKARGLPEHESRVSRTTVYDCFRADRKRIDTDLVMEIVRILEPSPAEVSQWSHNLDAFQRRLAAASVVNVSDQLPCAITGFVGRGPELHEILTHPVTWISGMPGAGKTQLALHAASHLLHNNDFDGALLADLRGFSPEGPPADPQAVVDGFLRLVGNQDRTASAATRVQRLREALMERNLLVLLDDAAEAHQVHAIFPDLTGLRVIITSRVVPEIIADAAPSHHISLPLFSRQDSLAALTTIAGEDLIHSDPDSASKLLDMTGDLPLAVRLTAARIAAKPQWSLSEHLELATTRYESLRLEDAIAQAFSLTYQSLDPAAQTMLRLLAEHPESLLDRASALALAAGVVADPQSALNTLVQMNLLTHPRHNRYAIHELVRVHAADVSLESDPPSWRLAARTRLISSLISRAWSAQRVLKEAVSEIPREPRVPITPVDFTPEEADEFFTDSADLLLTMALSGTDEPEYHDLLLTTSEAMMGWLHKVGRFDEAVVLHQEALRHATQNGDIEGEVRAQVSLGGTWGQMGHNTDAYKALIAVDGVAKQYPVENLSLQNSLGVVLDFSGNDAEAEERYNAALKLAQELGDLRRVGFAWNNLGKVYVRTGRMDDCRNALENSIQIAEQTNDHLSITRGKINLAFLLIELGEFQKSHDLSMEAYEHAKELNMVPGMIVSCSNLGASLLHMDRHGDAVAWLERGIKLATAAGMVQHLLSMEGNLAVCRRTLGAPHEAIQLALSAVANSQAVNDPELTEWAVSILAECLEGAPDSPLDHPNLAEIRAVVATLTTQEAQAVSAHFQQSQALSS